MKKAGLKSLSKFSPEKKYFVRRILDCTIIVFLLAIFSFTTTSNSSSKNKTVVSSNNFAPSEWLKCDGQLLPISQNEASFSLIGTNYGGDGETTFGLPDLQGRLLFSHGTGAGLPPMQLGQKGGVYETALSIGNTPAHNHNISATGNLLLPVNSTMGNLETDDPDGNFLTKQITPHYANSSSIGAGISFSYAGLNLNLSNTGNNIEFSNIPPYQGLGYYIAYQGTFPPIN